MSQSRQPLRLLLRLMILALILFLVVQGFAWWRRHQLTDALITYSAIADANSAGRLLHEGANANGRGVLEITPLISAVWGPKGEPQSSPARLKTIRLLLNAGANVNGRGFEGMTPLLAAVERNDFEAAKILLENGADTALAYDDGTSAIQLARKNQAAALMQLLSQAPPSRH